MRMIRKSEVPIGNSDCDARKANAMSKLVIRVAFIVIALYALRQAYLVSSGMQALGNDFRCYYTAGWLVRNNQSRDLYVGTENLDPSFERDHIDSGTVFART